MKINVKPLVWLRHGDSWEDPLYGYQISRVSGAGGSGFIVSHNVGRMKVCAERLFATHHEAEEAAQDHHRILILASIEVEG